MSSEASSISLRLKKIPEHLKIFIVYSDEDIIVIRKPSLLRSVRGVANHPDVEKKDKKNSKQLLENQEEEQDQKEEDEEGQQSAASSSNSIPVIISMQDAWVHAMRFYRNNRNAINASLNSCLLENKFDNVKEVGLLKRRALDMMINLASKTDETLGSISRRGTAFKKYVSRNRKTLLPCFLVKKKETKKCEKNIHHHAPKRKREDTADRKTCDKNDKLMDEITEIVFKILSTKTREIYSQATEYSSTKDEESADGQLNLLTKVSGDESITNLYGTLVPSNHETSIYVVHRLDCETSGIMVFARTTAAASFLSKAWRDRDRIVKKYIARVKHWPPFEDKGETSGSIHLAMGPMDNERIKWEIKDERIGGKSCETKWKVLQAGKTHEFVTLELIPVTGRTHQLRVHCAAIGSGIIGDSLYGENPVKLNDKTYYFEKPSQTLKLHAESLSFPHPSSNVVQTFICDSHWIDE